MTNRRRFLQCSLGTAALPLLPRAAAALPSRDTASFFVAGDTHYSADEKDMKVLKPNSAAYNSRLVDWLNKLPGTPIPEKSGGGTVPEPHGILHAGDMIDSGDKGPAKKQMMETETAAWIKDWGLNGGDGRLRWPVREVHGNHDGPRGDTVMVREIIARNKRRQGLTGVSDNGLHYSWDWAGVHFVALGIVAGDAPEVKRKRRYAPLGSLPFLREDLERSVGKSGRPVVLMHHVDVHRYSVAVPDAKALQSEWDYGDALAFYETIKPYRVAACLCGHTHARRVVRWAGSKDEKVTAGVPFLNTDNAGHFAKPEQAILHVEVSPSELRVREFFTKDGWTTGAWTPQIWKFALPA